MQQNKLRGIIETLLFITDKPLSVEKIEEIVNDDNLHISKTEILNIINEIKQTYEAMGSAISLREIASGYQFSTKPEYGEYIKKLFKYDMTIKISQPALETLSIIAYKQPVTRGEIEEIRGVDSSGVLETLIDKKLIHVLGRKETVGRPLLYGTTQEFLRYLGLKSLKDLPPFEDIIGPKEDSNQ